MKSTFLQSPIDIRLISNRLEIGFYRLVIDLLSDSKLLQKLITGACSLTWQLAPYLRALDRHRAARWAAAGLSIGFFTALISAVLNH
jgi:hypothetical protein